MEGKFRIGISSCLLGNEVRWNAGHKLDKYLTRTLGQFVEYVPVCPEVEAGFGVPRESFRLVGDPDKSDSPSSGMIRVKVYNEKGMPHKVGIGMFARAFMEHFPLIPVEDDGRLNDPLIREIFILQIFTMKRWRDNLARKPSMGNLVDFHTRNKLLIMSHSPKHYRSMGKLVANGKKMPIKELHPQYQLQLMDALKLKTTIKKHINVLQHVMGYFKKQLSSDEKQELLEVFDHYRSELVPLIVPITLINHYVRKYDQPYLKQQTYLKPHPVELKLRTHV